MYLKTMGAIVCAYIDQHQTIIFEKCTIKVINPEKVKGIFEHIKNYNVSEPAIGGVDSTNVHSFESTVSYANWAEASEIYFGALNREKMAISSVQHLQILMSERSSNKFLLIAPIE